MRRTGEGDGEDLAVRTVPDAQRGERSCGWCGRGPHSQGFCDRRGGRARKGWIRAAIIALLAERSMHGYEMISELKERTGGIWAPSPGSVYPALQLLADEELIQVEDEAGGGRRRYALTAAGRRIVEARRDAPAPWAAMAGPADPADVDLRQASAQVEAALAQVVATGNGAQKARAREVLAETRRALYRILAEDE